MYPQEQELLVVSLGTGLEVQPCSCDQVKNWALPSGPPIISVMLNSPTTVNYQMEALSRPELRALSGARDHESAAMDDASPENMARLDALSQEAVKRSPKELTRYAAPSPKTSRLDLPGLWKADPAYRVRLCAPFHTGPACSKLLSAAVSPYRRKYVTI